MSRDRHPRAKRTFAKQPFIVREVVIKMVWVLERTYEFNRMTIAQAIYAVLDAVKLVVEQADRVGLACHAIVTAGRGLPI
jgi:predicted nucleic-acid-binding protein